MTVTDFSTVANNISVTLPVFEIKPGAKRTLDAKKAFPGDRFVTWLDGVVDEDEYCEEDGFLFYKLNSRGKPETSEGHDLMPAWTLNLKELEYKGEVQISLRMFNEMAN